MDKILFWISVSANIVLFSLLVSHECDVLSKSKECNQLFCNKLRINNYKCSIAMLFLCLIFIATIGLGDLKYEQLNNYISFASTVSSMILSVLAIIMTINVEAKNENAKASIDFSLEKMQGIAREIKGYSENINQVHNDLKMSFDEIKNLVNATDAINDNTMQVKENIKEIKLTISELRDMTSFVKEIVEQNSGKGISTENLDKNVSESAEFNIPK